jgi:hypothetical protein
LVACRVCCQRCLSDPVGEGRVLVDTAAEARPETMRDHFLVALLWIDQRLPASPRFFHAPDGFRQRHIGQGFIRLVAWKTKLFCQTSRI